MEANGPTSTIEPQTMTARGRAAPFGRTDGDAETAPPASDGAPPRLDGRRGSGAPGSS